MLMRLALIGFGMTLIRMGLFDEECYAASGTRHYRFHNQLSAVLSQAQNQGFKYGKIMVA
jgi:hypothetical protein